MHLFRSVLLILVLFPILISAREVESHVFVLFGGNGDLAKHKIIPALAKLAYKGELPANFACIGIGRQDKSDETYRNELSNYVSHSEWLSLKDHIHYFKADISRQEDYEHLKDHLAHYSKNRIFYLSVASSYFSVIIENLKNGGLIHSANQTDWSRIIIEKPFGLDTDSAIDLQNKITNCVDESQVYRIDHYLGKEVVHQILDFRRNHAEYEKMWNKDSIKKVKITISEDIGVGSRGEFFEQTGLLRDLVQNHMMQTVSLIGMELPKNSSDQIDKKVNLLESIRPIDLTNSDVIRGQYGPGMNLLGYRQEAHVSENSNIETFVAAQLFIDNSRWKNVPFYLVAGKRMANRYAEVIVTFAKGDLVFRIQPEQAIFFQDKNENKKDLVDFSQSPWTEAYERLLNQCMKGEKHSFVSFKELLASWKIWTPVLTAWKNSKANFPNYPAGQDGPINDS